MYYIKKVFFIILLFSFSVCIYKILVCGYISDGDRKLSSFYVTTDVSVRLFGGDRLTQREYPIPTSWYMMINESGHYELSEDINCSEYDCCIFINVSDVVLNGMGHTICGLTASGFGIYICNASNITIRNITIYDFFLSGIWMCSSENITVTETKVICGVHMEGASICSCRNITIMDSEFCQGMSRVSLHYSEYNLIKNNTFNGSLSGILLKDSQHNFIKYNTFYGCGIKVRSSYENTVEENYVNGKPIVYLEGMENLVVEEDVGQIILVRCKEITVEGINIANASCAVQLLRTNNSVIKTNILQDNFDGIYLEESSNNTISGNTLHGSTDSSIIIHDCFNNTIANNVISNSSIGIYVESSRNNILYGNAISGVRTRVVSLFSKEYPLTSRGIHIEQSHNNVFANNTIQNWYCGIYVASASNNTIRYNLVANNSYGLILSSSTGNTIYLNNFISNLISYETMNNAVENRFYSPKQETYIYCGKELTGYLGNFWSNYSNGDQDENGIIDEPYGGDEYPLVDKVTIVDDKIIIGLYVEILSPHDGETINKTTITVTWRAIPGYHRIDHYEMYLDDNPLDTDIPPNQTNYTLNITDGTHTIEVRAIDEAGNICSCSITIMISTITISTTTTTKTDFLYYAVLLTIIIIIAMALLILKRKR